MTKPNPKHFKSFLTAFALATALNSLPVLAETSHDEDLHLVAALVWHEAGNQSYEGKRLVADVVFNRVMSDKFPNTIREVLNQKNQMMPVSELQKIVDAGIPQDCIDAVYEELDDQLDYQILYWNNTIAGLSGTYAFTEGDQHFGY